MFVYPNFLALLLVGFILSTGWGCANTPDEADSDPLERYVEETSAVLSPFGGGENDRGDASPEWSIVLSTIASGRIDHANRLLEAVQNQGGLPEAYIDQRAAGLVIAYGQYNGKGDPRAAADLERIREMTINHGRPYMSAFIAPPSTSALAGSNANHDLRFVKRRVGEENAVYTLQIGVYGRDDLGNPSPEELAEYRSAAESAVAQLRGEGEEAFYYHGAVRSMVTVGVFSRDDYDASVTPALESSPLREVREKFPNNTLNGMGIRETVRTERGKVQRIQRSQLVEIPKG